MSLQAQPADLVLRNGKIVTMNPAAPTAQAIAVRAGKITALGADSAAARWIGPNTKVIDLHGMLAIPGFIEGHGHFTGVGEFRMGLDLREARTWDEIVAQVGRAVKQAKPGEWIVGRGWHQSKWTVPPDAERGRLPAARFARQGLAEQSRACSPTPAATPSFVNGKALELAGVTGQTPNPSGGEILKDAKGAPTGLLRERASGVISRARARVRSQAHRRRPRSPRPTRRSASRSTNRSPRASPHSRTPGLPSPRWTSSRRWPTPTNCACASG